RGVLVCAAAWRGVEPSGAEGIEPAPCPPKANGVRGYEQATTFENSLGKRRMVGFRPLLFASLLLSETHLHRRRNRPAGRATRACIVELFHRHKYDRGNWPRPRRRS